MITRVTLAQNRGIVTGLLLTPLVLFIVLRVFPVFTSTTWQTSWYNGIVSLAQYYFSTLVGLLAFIIALLLWQGLGISRNARSFLLTLGFFALAAFQLTSSLGIPYLLLMQTIHPAFIWALFLSFPVSSIFFALAGVRWTAVVERRITTNRWYILMASIIIFIIGVISTFAFASPLASAPPNLSFLLFTIATASVIIFIWAAWRTDEINQNENSPLERQLAFTMILLAEAEIYLSFGLPGTLSWAFHQPILLTALLVTLIPLLKIAVRYQKEKRHRGELTQLIVHDLKSPLTIVISGLELLQRGNLGEVSVTQGNLISSLEHCSNEVLRLVDDMLDVERLEEGALTLKKRNQDISLIFSEQISELTILAEKHDQKLTLTMQNDLPLVYIDHAIIRRVVHNLVSNALKFTPNGGQISIEVKERGNAISVSVADSGPGIPPRQRQRVFEKFAQLESNGRRGKGLGLTFCKMAVEAHGGILTVEDSPLGGALFNMKLPIAAASPAAEQSNNQVLIV